MEALEKAADILSGTDYPFVIMICGDETHPKPLQMRYRGNYQHRMNFFAALANMIMDDYVEKEGYVVHEDLKNVLYDTIRLNDKQPNMELQEMVTKELLELCKNARRYDQEPQLSQSIKDFGDVDKMIHALNCCAEMNCVECPRFMDEDEDGENKYTTLCNQALMIEAALMLEEYADGTRRSNDTR